MSKLSDDVLVVCSDERAQIFFFPVFRWWDEGTVGPADSLPDQGYLLLERENHPESADTEGHTHTKVHGHPTVLSAAHTYAHTQIPPTHAHVAKEVK